MIETIQGPEGMKHGQAEAEHEMNLTGLWGEAFRNPTRFPKLGGRI